MRYIIRKVLTLIITLFMVSLLAFLAFQVIPGSPASSMLGTNATPEKIAALFQAGRYTATAKNNQSSHFILVQQELSILKELVWDHIDALTKIPATELPKELIPFASFNRHRKEDPSEGQRYRFDEKSICSW